MRKFAVGYLSAFEDELKIEIVFAADWRDALVKSKFIDEEVLNSLPDDLADAKQEAFNQDWNFDVKEIKA